MKHNLRGLSGRFISGCIYPSGCMCGHHVWTKNTKKHDDRCTSECKCSCINKSLEPQKESVSQGEKEVYVVALKMDEFNSVKEAEKKLIFLTSWKDSWCIYRVTKKYRVIQESKIVEVKL